MKFPATVLFTSHYDHARMGGQKSLLALVEHLDRTKIKPMALVTTEGELAEKLRALDCQTITFHLPDVRRGYFIRRWSSDAKKFFETVEKVRTLIKTHRVDILHADEEDDAATCVYAAKGTGAKVVYHVRVTGAHKLDGIIEKNVDGIMGVSDGTKHRFSASTLKKYRTVYDGIDCNLFKPAADKIAHRETLGLPTGKFIMLFVGQIKIGKGIIELVDALKILSKSLPPEKMPLLLVAGVALQESFMTELLMQVERDELKSHIRFLGQQSNVHNLMQVADVILLPSHDGVEGLPRVLFEAMACGAVPLGTDIAGIREVILPGTGFLVPQRAAAYIAEKLLLLMSDAALLARLSRNAVESATARFDIRIHTAAIEQFYAEML
jgi:glycosyltransferase involved in cell wall biosynthesis